MATNAEILPYGTTMAERVAAATRSGAGVSPSDATAPSRRVRLWDVVAEAWTAPLLEQDAYSHYLRKVVTRCTACPYASIFPEDGPKHITAAKKFAAGHRDAKVVECSTDDRQMFRCDSCGFVARSERKAWKQAKDHLATIDHSNATAVDVLLFRQEPPSAQIGEPLVQPTPARTSNGHVDGGWPDVHMVVREPRKRIRKRSRGRRSTSGES